MEDDVSVSLDLLHYFDFASSLLLFIGLPSLLLFIDRSTSIYRSQIRPDSVIVMEDDVSVSLDLLHYFDFEC